MVDHLFEVRSIRMKRPIKVYGVDQNKFLVYSVDGWMWVNHKHFVPINSVPKNFENIGIHFTDQRHSARPPED